MAPNTVSRKVACAALVYAVGEGTERQARVAVNGEIVELPDDETTKARTDSGLLIDPAAELLSMAAETTVVAPTGAAVPPAAPPPPGADPAGTGLGVGTGRPLEDVTLASDEQIRAMNVDDVRSYVEAHPGELARVVTLEQERGETARKTVLALGE